MPESIRWPGNHGPVASPRRRDGSVRRTTTIDGHRPDGPLGDVVLSCCGRDLATAADGAVTVLADQVLDARADFVHDQAIRMIEAHPSADGLASLVGVPSRSGFRRVVNQQLPGRAGDGSLLSLFLDEIPIVTSLSRLALIQREAIDLRPGSGDPANRRRGHVNLCAGWAAGSAMNERIDGGRAPLLTAGVAAPSWDDSGDPFAWHAVAPLPSDGFRRRRRIDLTPVDAGTVEVDSIFRDTYVNVDGIEHIVHEYAVTATVDPTTGIFKSCAARADVLPGPECQNAVASAARFVGLHASDALAYVRGEMTGASTCTHLNDHLRALGDVHALLKSLPA